MKELVNWLLNMLDKSTRQTLCVMPVGFNEKPTEWKDIKNGNFFIINNQHSVKASKWMMDDANKVDKEEREHFWKWKCFVVWSNDPEKLRTISAFYNRTNHFQVTQPSWATNILGARTVWEAMGRPRNPTQAASVGTNMAMRQTMEVRRNREAFQVCTSARIALICKVIHLPICFGLQFHSILESKMLWSVISRF